MVDRLENEREINKKRWEEWRAKHDSEREKTYFHCWSDWGDWSDCSIPSGAYIDFPINWKRSGESSCGGGAGSWEEAVCGHNSIMRFARAGKSSELYDNLSGCYWLEKKDSGCREHCYMEEYGWNYPIHIASVSNSSIPYNHSICAEYLGGDKTNLNNWKFFQYYNMDIQPGDNQMPCGTSIENTKIWITEVDNIQTNCSSGVYGTRVACFELDENCNIYCVNCP